MTVKELKNTLNHMDENADITIVKADRQMTDAFDRIFNYDLDQVMSVTAGVNEDGVGESMVWFMIE